MLDDVQLVTASPELQTIEWGRRLDYAPLADAPSLVPFSFPVEERGADALFARHERFREILARLAEA